MVEIWGVDQQKLKFTVLAYQFGGGSHSEYDRNWLRIVIDVDSKQGKWKSNDPSLLTWELLSIIDWFKAIRSKKNTETRLEFIEPNLAFSILEEQPERLLIRVHFDLESRPPNPSDQIDYYFDFQLNNKGLNTLISRLEREIINFPVRTRL